MYLSTIDSLAFVVQPPDWSKKVRWWQKWSTFVQTSKNGTEQRNAARSRPSWSIAYVAAALATEEWASRRAGLLAELAAALVVPCWTVPEDYVSAAGDVVTLGAASLARTPFLAGSYAYFEESGLASVFRKVTAVGATSITLEAGLAAYPAVAVPAYTSAALVYPCIVAQRMDNAFDASHEHVHETDEVLAFEEIGVQPTS